MSDGKKLSKKQLKALEKGRKKRWLQLRRAKLKKLREENKRNGKD